MADVYLGALWQVERNGQTEFELRTSEAFPENPLGQEVWDEYCHGAMEEALKQYRSRSAKPVVPPKPGTLEFDMEYP